MTGPSHQKVPEEYHYAFVRNMPSGVIADDVFVSVTGHVIIHAQGRSFESQVGAEFNIKNNFLIYKRETVVETTGGGDRMPTMDMEAIVAFPE